ncbi:MAG: lytic murein transglycosylase [Pseudomonadota bacterium]
MKKKTVPARKYLIFIILFFLLLAIVPPLPAQTTAKKGTELDAVASQLIQDGFDPAKIQAIFSKESVFFTSPGVATFFSYFESSGDPYRKFTQPKAIDEAQKYLELHKTELDQAQKEYGVDKTIITAILLVESWLGTYPIEHTAVNILATIASLKDETLREKIWETIPDKKKPKKKIFTKKIEDRLNWGYAELKALIQYTEKQGFEIDTIKGSFAGAIGYCQFMPSNALTLAKDGNNDGKIDLFTHPDAIFSVANYLKHHGWKPNLPRQKQHEVLFKYNHSNYYVDTLLVISDKLQK